MAMTKAKLLNLDGAQITRDGTGVVTIDDPDSPLVVMVTVGPSTRTPRQITELVIRARHPAARITPAALSRLPLAQIRHIAARSDPHPNDVVQRMMVTPKPLGCGSWPPGHWREVLDVYTGAVETGRPGGGVRAVADMWDVALNPTAYRWVRKAKELDRSHREAPGTGHLLEP